MPIFLSIVLSALWENVYSSNDSLPIVILPTTVCLMSVRLMNCLPNDFSPKGVREGETCLGGGWLGQVRLG